MKLFSTLAALLFIAGAASAQYTTIGDPPAHSKTPWAVKAGDKFTFRLESRNLPSGHPTELGVSASLQSCAKGCDRNHPFTYLGTSLLTKANFHPAFHKNGPTTYPYQIFTVTIPGNALKGLALLGVRRESTNFGHPLTENFGIELDIK